LRSASAERQRRRSVSVTATGTATSMSPAVALASSAQPEREPEGRAQGGPRLVEQPVEEVQREVGGEGQLHLGHAAPAVGDHELHRDEAGRRRQAQPARRPPGGPTQR
jgi:hypothetical protein